jgi:hypothetical protein
MNPARHLWRIPVRLAPERLWQFAAYYGCAKAHYRNHVIAEQKQRVAAESQADQTR